MDFRKSLDWKMGGGWRMGVDREKFQLGNQEFVVDENAKEGGEPYYEGEETIEEHKVGIEEASIPASVQEWKSMILPVRESRSQYEDERGVIRLCKNERCDQN